MRNTIREAWENARDRVKALYTVCSGIIGVAAGYFTLIEKGYAKELRIGLGVVSIVFLVIFILFIWDLFKNYPRLAWIITVAVVIVAILLGKRLFTNWPPPPPATPTPVSSSPSPTSDPFQVGAYFSFGSFEQDGNLENGSEPIEWQVLARENGKVLALSKHGLEYQVYNPSGNNSWDKSELRKYLIGEFYDTAFNMQEKLHIEKVRKQNNRADPVFCLSVEEVYEYFPKETTEDWKTRICEPTVFAADSHEVPEDHDSGAWWLRTPGDTGKVACVRGINPTNQENGALPGAVLESGYNANGSNVLVRPAIWFSINLDSSDFPDVDGTVEFGAYMQSKTETGGWSRDAISWIVLARDDETALLLSEKGLTYKQVSADGQTTRLPWEETDLYSWLTTSFCDTSRNNREGAFTEKERKVILQRADGTCEVSILSEDEAEKYFIDPNERICKPTEYAGYICENNPVSDGGQKPTPNYNGDHWWLCTTGSDHCSYMTVDNFGLVKTGGTQQDYYGIMVRPTIMISIERFMEIGCLVCFAQSNGQ